MTAEGQLWLSYQRGTQLLERAIDRNLRETSGISHADFQILAMLSSSPCQRLRMGTLAELVTSPKSRLNYQISRLEERGLIIREPDSVDGRGLNAVLTDDGERVLTEAAAGHIETIRTYLLANLQPTHQKALRTAMDRIANAIDSAASGCATELSAADRK